MSKGFKITCEGYTFSADKLNHEVITWDDEKPKADIVTAVNGDLDIISEGSQPEFEILFWGLSEAQYKSLLLIRSKIAIFNTETENDITLISNTYENMFVSMKTVNISGATAFPALQVKLQSTKAGAIINGALIENVCFSTNDNYQQYDMTDEGKVIIYKG